MGEEVLLGPYLGGGSDGSSRDGSSRDDGEAVGDQPASNQQQQQVVAALG
jgi:hypothetical protein